MTHQHLVTCTVNGQRVFVGSAGPGQLVMLTDEERRAPANRPGRVPECMVTLLMAGVAGPFGLEYARAIKGALGESLGPEDLRRGWSSIAGQVSLGRLMRVVRDSDEELSSVWPMLRDVAVWLMAQESVPAGSPAVLDQVLFYLPEVQAAVSSGLADPKLLSFPGLADFAARKGSSSTLTKARLLHQRLKERSHDGV